MTRIYIFAAIALALAGSAYYVHHLRTRNAALTAELDTARASLVAERENTRKANAASNLYQADLTRVSHERDNALHVRLCHSPAVRTGAAASGSDAAPTGHVGEASAGDPGPDIGDALLEYGIACEANQLQLARLQEWVRGR